MGDENSELSHFDDSTLLLRDVLRSSLDVIIATDHKRKIRLFNPAAERAFGYASEEVLGSDVEILYADPAQMQRILSEVSGSDTYEGEVLNRAKDGRTFTSYLSAAAMRGPDGRTRGYMGVSRDVSRLRRAEAELAKSEARYHDLLEAANSIVLRWNAQGLITFMNQYGLDFFGFTAEELIGMPVVGTIVPAAESTGRDLVELMEDIHVHPERYANNQNQNVRKDGTLVWVSWTNKHIQWEHDGPYEILSIGNDITLLKEYELALGEKSTQLAEANIALTNTNELLRAADRMKSVFIASMSHELRTPLNSIIGFTGILLQGLPGPINDEQRKQLGIVRESSRHLLELINEVLDISKIEAGRVDLFLDNLELRALAATVLDSLSVSAQSKGLALLNTIPKDIVLYTDAGRLKQILINLAGNAVKFTDSGQVSIGAEIIDGRCHIHVSDTGPGIAASEHVRLFQPFLQIDMSLTRRHTGTGLGLYLSRKIARLLGGDARVASEEGQGSTFTVELPLQCPGPAAEDPAGGNEVSSVG